jgi:hypothetical protein
VRVKTANTSDHSSRPIEGIALGDIAWVGLMPDCTRGHADFFMLPCHCRIGETVNASVPDETRRWDRSSGKQRNRTERDPNWITLVQWRGTDSREVGLWDEKSISPVHVWRRDLVLPITALSENPWSSNRARSAVATIQNSYM